MYIRVCILGLWIGHISSWGVPCSGLRIVVGSMYVDLDLDWVWIWEGWDCVYLGAGGCLFV